MRCNLSRERRRADRTGRRCGRRGAAARLRRARSRTRLMKAPTRPTSWEALLDQAEERVEDGDLEAALELCEQAVALAPGQVDGHLLEADIRLGLEDPRGAAEAARRALDLDPEDDETRALLGEALFE